MKLKPTNEMEPAHAEMLVAATKITTPVVTYGNRNGRGDPLSHGTGFFLKHGPRHYVITNTHVLELYAAAQLRKEDARVQVWAGEGVTGSEFHGRKLIVPNNRASMELGVSSEYDHQDVGIIELTDEAADLAGGSREFVEFDSLNVNIPGNGEEVYYKGYPKKSAEFHGPIESSVFGQWLDVRRVRNSSGRLIICDPTVAVYRSKDFPEEEGKDLHGVSGSALMEPKKNTVVGIVWGGLDSSVESEVYACPAATIRRLILAFEKITGSNDG